jgi:hypothetical protein
MFGAGRVREDDFEMQRFVVRKEKQKQKEERRQQDSAQNCYGFSSGRTARGRDGSRSDTADRDEEYGGYEETGNGAGEMNAELSSDEDEQVQEAEQEVELGLLDAFQTVSIEEGVEDDGFDDYGWQGASSV